MTAKRITVLVVDDSAICRETARLMLGELGFHVLTLDTPLGFSGTVLKLRPDVALVDVGMPGLQGNQLVEIANRHGAGAICPVILFSDRKRVELEALASTCGAAGAINKSDNWPGIARELHLIIRRWRRSVP